MVTSPCSLCTVKLQVLQQALCQLAQVKLISLVSAVLPQLSSTTDHMHPFIYPVWHCSATTCILHGRTHCFAQNPCRYEFCRVPVVVRSQRPKLCCSKIAEAEAAMSVNEKKWLVMHMHVQLDEAAKLGTAVTMMHWLLPLISVCTINATLLGKVTCRSRRQQVIKNTSISTGQSQALAAAPENPQGTATTTSPHAQPSWQADNSTKLARDRRASTPQH